jgi:hypothetical protein
MNQALDIWSELWQAYYGKNGYGGDTAEIYAYKLMPYSPTINLDGDSFTDGNRVSYVKAQYSLYHIVIKFINDNNCTITIDGKSPTDWLESQIFDHRCHVQVKPHRELDVAHNHYRDNGTTYSHSHMGGNNPHGHHGSKYGLPLK